MRSEFEVERVLELVKSGLNDCEIARTTDIPRSTVRMWRVGLTPRSQRMGGCCVCEERWAAIPSRNYAYLLGQYLGDGFISRLHRGVFRLRIFSDSRYTDIIDECSDSIRAVMPRNKVAIEHVLGVNMVVISAYSKHWPCLFPQHGPGRKHNRKILLDGWQVSIVQDHPEAFLRGLIHSDGCRVMNRVQNRKYSYPRYNFTNESDDIKRLFAEACDRLGIANRRMNQKTISVARREAVATMDTFIGPKT